MRKRTQLRMAYGGPRIRTPFYYRRFTANWTNAVRLWWLALDEEW